MLKRRSNSFCRSILGCFNTINIHHTHEVLPRNRVITRSLLRFISGINISKECLSAAHIGLCFVVVDNSIMS
ncbi:hypothetical protein Hdeb2414_s0015g00452291 [Helianthus debilis subsp. tardiflorus]